MARTAPVSAVADPEVSASSEVAVALGAALCSGIAVSPFLMCVDRGVVASAAGTAPGGSLFRAIASVAGEFVTKPKAAFGAPALWMVAGVYGGTYFAKNLSDVIIRRGRLEHNPAAGACKFVATTATNAGGSILKDAAFARMYGAAAAGAVAVVPPASYALFALRDCLTIGGAFFVPELMAGAMKTALPADRVGAADAAAQLVSPPLMQVLCTPMHLLALDLVNQPAATAAARVARLKNSTPAALFARSLRMLPAYGVGGLLNTSLTERGRAAAIARRDARASPARREGPSRRCSRRCGGRRRRSGQAARAKVAAASAPREARDASASSTTAALNASASASASGGDAASADQGRRGRAAASQRRRRRSRRRVEGAAEGPAEVREHRGGKPPPRGLEARGRAAGRARGFGGSRGFERRIARDIGDVVVGGHFFSAIRAPARSAARARGGGRGGGRG
jgi:hypothetical protein